MSRMGLHVWGVVAVGGPVLVAVVYGIFKLHSLAIVWLALRHAPDAEVHAGLFTTRVTYRHARERGGSGGTRVVRGLK